MWAHLEFFWLYVRLQDYVRLVTWECSKSLFHIDTMLCQLLVPAWKLDRFQMRLSHLNLKD